MSQQSTFTVTSIIISAISNSLATMSIADILDCIRFNISSNDPAVDFETFNTKVDETSDEYIQSTFLTPSTHFSNQWLNNLQEYVISRYC